MDKSSDNSDEENNFEMSVVDVTPSYRRMSSAYSSNMDDSNMMGISTSQFGLDDSQIEGSLLRKKSQADDIHPFDEKLQELIKRKDEIDGI